MAIDSKGGPGPLGRRIEGKQFEKALSTLRNFFTSMKYYIEELSRGESPRWQILGDLQKEYLKFLIQKRPEILDVLTKEEKEELRRVFEDNPPKNVSTFGSALSKLAEKILNLEL